MARVVAEVLEELPSQVYRLRSGGRHEILGRPAPGSERNFLRLVRGDRVEVELSETDPGRGRIVSKLGSTGE